MIGSVDQDARQHSSSIVHLLERPLPVMTIFGYYWQKSCPLTALDYLPHSLSIHEVGPNSNCSYTNPIFLFAQYFIQIFDSFTEELALVSLRRTRRWQSTMCMTAYFHRTSTRSSLTATICGCSRSSFVLAWHSLVSPLSDCLWESFS